ncbi:MAG: saccharopine dehydrogenase NADP-binding domain-containing protein [Deltaproteobacteria bacterium]|nr:saccharopine dehydrogenase NADP-binding domain-containing protein [Deltaproteobacteria bacterium]
MARVVVLGGCGAVGSVATRTLAGQDVFAEVIIADANETRGNELSATLGPKVSFVRFDARDAQSVAQAIRGSDVVLNCVGPFYKTVKTVLGAVIDAGVNYVDVCDDVDVTVEILGWSDDAARRGVTAVIGMGSSPGATNLLAKLAATALLDETDSIDIFHAHGGEPFEGPGVIGHRFHCMSIPIPMFLDGALKYVSYFEPDGIALRQTFSFPVLGDDIMLYPYPHPEQVTLPRHLKLRQVTNKGTVLPAEYYDLTREICRLGLHRKEPVEVHGGKVSPHDFSVAYIIEKREEILERTNFGPQRGCCSVVAKGKKGGAYREYRFHMASRSQALGEGTGIPAAIGAILLQKGLVTEKGVLPPEACIEPMDFVQHVPQVMKMDEKKEGGDSFGGVIVQKVDENGNVMNVNI